MTLRDVHAVAYSAMNVKAIDVVTGKPASEGAVGYVRKHDNQSRLLRGHTLLASPHELDIFFRTRCLVPSCECGSRFRRYPVSLRIRNHSHTRVRERERKRYARRVSAAGSSRKQSYVAGAAANHSAQRKPTLYRHLYYQNRARSDGWRLGFHGFTPHTKREYRCFTSKISAHSISRAVTRVDRALARGEEPSLPLFSPYHVREQRSGPPTKRSCSLSFSLAHRSAYGALVPLQSERIWRGAARDYKRRVPSSLGLLLFFKYSTK
ncbi:unnamed protein product [Trichogramma brassicae]|uniref:Uncharacterized protein n=1 Tax=Trichogramma brassicae TaxID=86971 RepID=A0A6H5IJZ0_9HYME|nr:unnamed protein product [Trichogramma brassicae]